MGWIRSQNKKVLEDVREFVVREVGGSFELESRLQITKFKTGIFKKGIINSVSYLHLGSFPTQEAALEELDRIADWISLQDGKGVYQVSQP